MNKVLLVLMCMVAVVGISGVASAHVEVGVDLNGDGDCNDAGESVANVPTLGLLHHHVCA